MEKPVLNPRLRLVQQADLRDKVVLLRVDHNVVKKGGIKDPYRIEATLGTICAVVEKGGRPILMSHVGRPRDKKTGRIHCTEDTAVTPIVRYLEQKLPVTVHVPTFPTDPEQGILQLDPAVTAAAIDDLKQHTIGMIYLPNTRWFRGEQAKGTERDRFADQLAGLADVYVNDAFGSWQPHASTYDVATRLPAYAGCLLQKELENLGRVLEPERPFVAVIAGAKYDTKIGPLKALHARVDRLILGGLMYNTYLAAKHDVHVAGVADDDRALARQLVELDAAAGKIVELPYLTEAASLESPEPEKTRTVEVREFQAGKRFQYLVDVHPRSFEESAVRAAVGSARTIFVNAVMGFMPHYPAGSEALFRLIAANTQAQKLLAGGDTLQEFRNLCPGLYLKGLDADDTYYFTGGGSVLSAIEFGSPYRMKPFAALLQTED